MAVIGKIRQRSWLLIGFIAVAMLLFLMMDALSSNSMMGSDGKQKVGNINGKSIPVQEFSNRYNKYENNIRAINPQRPIDDATSAAIRQEVWNNITGDALLGNNMEKLGLSVSPIEIANGMWGDNIHPIVKNLFTNPDNGQFDPNQVRSVMENVDDIDETGRLREQLTAIQDIIEEDRKKSKYGALINKGVYIPSFIAKEQGLAGSKTANVTYLSLPYIDIPNDEIEVSDKEITTYLNNHAYDYKQEANSDLEYVQINIIPSSYDSSAALERITNLKQEFIATENDSLYVKRNSNIPFDNAYFTKEQLATRGNTEEFFNMQTGEVFGPYLQGGAYKLTKVKGKMRVADSIRASHILFAFNTIAERDSVFALADSLIELLNKNRVSFGDMAAIHSQDGGSKINGGDLGYFKQGQMVKPFNDAVFFNSKQGDIVKAVSNFGLHVIKNTRSKPSTPAVQLAEIVQTLRAGKETEKELYRKALEFQENYNTSESFEAAKEEYDVLDAKNITQNQVDIAGLGNARDVVQWAFKSKKGAVQFFDLDNKFIIAHLKNKNAKGLQSLDKVRSEIELKVSNEKKAEIILADLTPKLSGVTDIQALASTMGQEVKRASGVRYLSSYVEGGAGSEPNLVAAIYGTAENTLSKPIIGDRAVYVFQTNSFTEPTSPTNVELSKLQIKSGLISKLSYASILEALKKESKIEDNIYNYY